MRLWEIDPTTGIKHWREEMHLAHRAFELSPYNARMEIVDAARGYVATSYGEPQRRKVALIGAGYGREEAPYEDPEWEVWALNVVGAWDRQKRLRADRWWEIHEAKAQSADDMTWISRCPVPIYLPPAFAQPYLDGRKDSVQILDDPAGALMMWHGAIPNAVAYPLERIEKAYGGYWACTFAYQLALALAEGFTDVGLYGVDLAHGTLRERTVEWACVSWWVGFLEARGVTIHMPSNTMLGRHPYRYGIEYTEEKDAVQRYTDRFHLAEDEDTQVLGMGG